MKLAMISILLPGYRLWGRISLNDVCLVRAQAKYFYLLLNS